MPTAGWGGRYGRGVAIETSRSASGRFGRGAEWTRPPRRRARLIADRLREMYGPAVLRPHREPLDELILTVLSQSTSDGNRDLAYGRLRDRFPTWREEAAAPVSEVERAIRPGGLSRVKSLRIQEILLRVDRATPRAAEREDISLDWLAGCDRSTARRFLEGLPGVGRKTAACVLLFSLGWLEFPVDTHVMRVGVRLGMIRPGASTDEAHESMLCVSSPEEAYELHINLIRHGRQRCRPEPRCADCALRRMCRFSTSDV